MKKTGAIILCIAFIIGLFGAGALLADRVKLENENRGVTVVMAFEDVRAMGEKCGVGTDEMLSELSAAGVDGVIVNNGSSAELVSSAGLGTASLKATEGEGNTMKLYFLSEKSSGNDVGAAAKAGDVLVLTENEEQTGADLQITTKYAVEAFTPQCLKCFRLADKYAERYKYLGYSGAEEIENILFRAVTDRNVRVLWLTPFMDGENMVTDTEEYARLLTDLGVRLGTHGITLCGDSTPTEYSVPDLALLLAAAIGICAAGVFFLWTIFGFKTPLQIILLLAAALVSAVGLYLVRYTMISLLALAAAISFPCIAVYIVTVEIKSLLRSGAGLGGSIVSFIAILVSGVICCVFGGGFIGAVMSGSRFMLELDMFTGVKVSQALPLLYSVFIIWREIYHEKGRSFGDDLKEAYGAFRKGAKLKVIVIAVLIVLAAAVYIMRTGDGMLGVPAFELRVRNFLEHVLFVRPRTKEMLIAYPCCAVMVTAAAKRWKNAVLPFGVLTAVGLAGVCNTFCHIRADFVLSLCRTFTGLAIGFVLGIIVICVLFAIGRKHKQN